jgi:hypothetical protein
MRSSPSSFAGQHQRVVVRREGFYVGPPDLLDQVSLVDILQIAE